jgi:predicted ester cyclase
VHKAVGKHTVVVEDSLEEGDKVAGRFTFRGIHSSVFFGVTASGHEITWSAAAFFTFRDGLIIDVWFLGDVDGLKNQLGAEADATAF